MVRMSLVLYEVENHPLFPTLTEQQKIFVRKYVEKCDGEAAAVEAYGDIARPLAVANRLLVNGSIRQVLSITEEMKKPPVSDAEFARLLSSRIRGASSDKMFIELGKLRETFLDRKETKRRPGSNVQEPSIDDLVLQMEKERGQ